MVLCAALATITSEAGLLHWHWLFKPLTMVIAIVLVATSAYPISVRGQFDSKSWWLLGAALVGSLAGDAFLMVEGFFIPGLVSFLLAHIAYIVLFRQAWPGCPGLAPWPPRWAWAAPCMPICGKAGCPPNCAFRWRCM
jgi:uncharacterized membrane protein YhhN